MTDYIEPTVPRWQRVAHMADRFIANRSATNMEALHQHLCTPNAKASHAEPALHQHGSGKKPSRILAFAQKPLACQKDDLKCLYTYSSHYASPIKSLHRRKGRVIATQPERILDAPNLVNDYYLNLLDWSSQNVLAIGLANTVYLWDASRGLVTQLLEYHESDYATAVQWTQDGRHLAVACSNTQIQIWDPEKQVRLRAMKSHESRASCLSFNGHSLTSGSKDGSIHHHDVRVAKHHIATLKAHSHEVCGLKWSPNGRQLASGANDNLIHIYDEMSVSPTHRLSQHTAAVKALAWCPWKASLLASGGGAADQSIRFWDTFSGHGLHQIHTQSQVTGLVWSQHYKEILSAHGFSENQLIIWNYPSLTKLAELSGHDSRILHVALSPDGQTVASAAADENLKFWRCFETCAEQASQKVPAAQTASVGWKLKASHSPLSQMDQSLQTHRNIHLR